MGDKEHKSAKKEKKEKKPKTPKAEAPASPGGEEEAQPRPAGQLAVIAKPLADPKLSKKVLKLAKKAAKRKTVKRGVKEVIKAIRKGVKGVCVIAGDISPIDVITPLPVLCEDADIPYVFVPSKDELGQAGLTKRPTSCMLLLPKPIKGELPTDEEGKEYKESYEEVSKKVAALAHL